jgi:hypothetical protein
LPIYREIRVIPLDSKIKTRIIEIITLIEKLGIILECEESMRESARNIEHFFVLGGENESFPLTKS